MPPPMLRKQTTQIRVQVHKGPLNFEHDIENSSLQGVGHFNKQALVHLPRELLCDGVLLWALNPRPEKSRVLFIATSELGSSMGLLERTSPGRASHRSYLLQHLIWVVFVLLRLTV